MDSAAWLRLGWKLAIAIAVGMVAALIICELISLGYGFAFQVWGPG